MNCTHCGALVSDQTQFCPHCGHTIGETTKQELHPLLKRALLFIQEGNVVKADNYCEQVLDQEPENAYAYVIQLMIRAKVKEESELAAVSKSFADWNSYQNALRFADVHLRTKLESYLQSTEAHIQQLEEEARIQEQMRLEEEQRQRIHNIYQTARQYDIENAPIADLEKAIMHYRKISGYLDAEKRLLSCRDRLKEAQTKRAEYLAEAQRKKRRKKWIISIVIVVIIFSLIGGAILYYNQTNMNNANRAKKLQASLQNCSFSGSYSTTEGAYESFSVPDYIIYHDITYHFDTSGNVVETGTHSYLKGVHKVIDGKPQYERVINSNTPLGTYRVDVSFWGDVTVTFDGTVCELRVNSSDQPLDIIKNGVAYSINS